MSTLPLSPLRRGDLCAVAPVRRERFVPLLPGWLPAMSAALITLVVTAPVLAQVPAQVPAVTRLAAGDGAAGSRAAEPAVAPAAAASAPAAAATAAPAPPERVLTPFEQLATEAHGRPVLRLGTGPRTAPSAVPATPMARVPADYLLQPGDEVAVAVWGSIDGQWTLRVDRAGRIVLPRVGPVVVAGRPQQALPGLLRQRLDTVFRDYQLSAAVSEPGPVAVQLTGFVDQPGERVFPPLTTLAGALARSVGPGSPGSLRRVQLLRDGQPIVAFDLYQLLQTGSRRDDRLLQPGDVVHVEAAGAQVAVVGSVNRPAVFELLPGETVGDALRLAGGLSPVADRGVLLLQRMGQRQGRGMEQLQLPRDLGLALEDGDLLQAGAGALIEGPSQRRNKRLRISGEVQRPGDYLLRPDSTLDQALAAAGGATPAALLYGTALRRDSVRRLQEQNLQRALREMETSLLEEGARSAGPAGPAPDSGLAGRELLASLRARQPEGRMVLDLAPDATVLPPLPLEDGDQIHVPPRSQTVGVFGSVANPGSFVHQASRSVADYLQRAGGPRERADADATFVIRANGEVVAAPGRWWRGERLAGLPALPGDTVFVPERPLTSRLMQDTKDWTQVLYQLGLGVAALLAVR